MLYDDLRESYFFTPSLSQFLSSIVIGKEERLSQLLPAVLFELIFFIMSLCAALPATLPRPCMVGYSALVMNKRWQKCSSSFYMLLFYSVSQYSPCPGFNLPHYHTGSASHYATFSVLIKCIFRFFSELRTELTPWKHWRELQREREVRGERGKEQYMCVRYDIS